MTVDATETDNVILKISKNSIYDYDTNNRKACIKLQIYAVDISREGLAGVQQSLGLGEIGAPREGRRIGWRNVELVNDGYLEQIHLGRNDNHMVGSDLHPVR